MDTTQIAVLTAVIGLAGAFGGVLIGAGISEFFARQRETSAREYSEQRARADRVRADRLEAIDQTHRAMVATLNRLLSIAAGDPNAAGIPVGTHEYPRLNPLLVNDVDVQRAYTAICTELVQRVPGRLSARDHDNIATVETAIGKILEEQRQRALRDEDLPLLAMNELLAHPEVGLAYTAMNIEPKPRAQEE